MHAFLLIGNSTEGLLERTNELAMKFNARVMEYPLNKIEDVRNLNNFLRLTITEPTLIYSPNIQDAGVEALNAFLKNLEEPQKDLYFVLTAPSLRKVLPTIVSRCQIIKLPITNYQLPVNDEIINFQTMSTEQRSAFFDKIKDRGEAISFIENFIFFLHEKKDFTNMEFLLKTLTRLKANGNVNLHLTNLVFNLK